MPPDGRAHVTAHITKFVMPGQKRVFALDVPGIHVFNSKAARKTWMAGHRRAEATPSFGRLCPAMTVNERAHLAGKYPRDDLFQDLPANGFVGAQSVAPPPAVLLHFLGRGDKALRHLRKIRVGV